MKNAASSSCDHEVGKFLLDLEDPSKQSPGELMQKLQQLFMQAPADQANHLAETVGKALSEIPHVLANFIPAVEHLDPALTDWNSEVRRAAAYAVAALAHAAASVSPSLDPVFVFDIFLPLLKPLWEGIMRRKGQPLADIALALCAVIRILNPAYASYYAGEVLRCLPNLMDSPSEDLKGVCLRIIRQCLGIGGHEVRLANRDYVAHRFFNKLWVRSEDAEYNELLIQAAVAMAKLAGLKAVKGMIAEQLAAEGDIHVCGW